METGVPSGKKSPPVKGEGFLLLRLLVVPLLVDDPFLSGDLGLVVTVVLGVSDGGNRLGSVDVFG